MNGNLSPSFDEAEDAASNGEDDNNDDDDDDEYDEEESNGEEGQTDTFGLLEDHGYQVRAGAKRQQK